MGMLRKNLDNVEGQLSKKKSLQAQIHDALNSRAGTIKGQEDLLRAHEESQAGTAAKIQGYAGLIARHEQEHRLLLEKNKEQQAAVHALTR